MYFGNVSDFLNNNKNWLITQPKFRIKKSNLVEYIKIDGKYYKMDLSTGKLEIIEKSLEKRQEKSDKQLINKFSNKKLASLSVENKNNINAKKRNIISRNGINSVNKKQNLTLQTNFYKVKNKSIIKSTPRKITETSMSKILSKTYRPKINNENLFTPKSRIIKNKIFKSTAKNLQYQKLIKETKNKGLLYNLYTSSESKKNISNFDEKNPNDIFQDVDLYDLNKNENDTELVKKIKNQIFKNKIFHVMRKHYNFYNDNKTKLVKIPNINLAAAKNKFLENTKKDCFNKIYFLHREELIKKIRK